MLNAALIQIANQPLIVFVISIIQITSFTALRRVDRQFAAITNGHETFDFQNGLTPAQIEAQLPDYSPASKALYTRFFLLDLLFPFAASLFLSLIWAALLQRPNVPLFAGLFQAGAFWFPFVVTLADWGENVCFLLIINRYPVRMPAVMMIGVVFKRLKLLTLVTTMLVTLFLLLATGVVVVQGILQGGR